MKINKPIILLGCLLATSLSYAASGKGYKVLSERLVYTQGSDARAVQDNNPLPSSDDFNKKKT